MHHINRAITIIRYRYLFRARLRVRSFYLHIQRRVLWKLFADKAVYKPYKDLRGHGSGWVGRYIWRGIVVCYVDKRGDKWQ